MREIKFRGTAATGLKVYGSLVERCYSTGILYYQIVDKRGNEYSVDKESISQFCGYDSEGNEIYEGDEVIADGKTYTVALKPEYGLFGDLKFCVKK